MNANKLKLLEQRLLHQGVTTGERLILDVVSDCLAPISFETLKRAGVADGDIARIRQFLGLLTLASRIAREQADQAGGAL